MKYANKNEFFFNIVYLFIVRHIKTGLNNAQHVCGREYEESQD